MTDDPFKITDAHINESQTSLQRLRDMVPVPKVISRFGWILIERNGSQYLAAATLEELAAAMFSWYRAHGHLVDLATIMARLQRRVAEPACWGTAPDGCVPVHGCRRCITLYWGEGVWSCECTEW